MLIKLDYEPRPYSSVSIEGSNDRIQLPIKNMIVLDTNILLPSILPPKIGPEVVEKCRYKISRVSFPSGRNSRHLEIVRAIEKSKFQQGGRLPATTTSCFHELETMSQTLRMEYFHEWRSRNSKYMYEIDIHPMEELYQRYRPLWDAIKDKADFSIAVAAHLLGCILASDDSIFFNYPTKQILTSMYFERWGSSQKKPKTQDSYSLCKLLKTKF